MVVSTESGSIGSWEDEQQVEEGKNEVKEKEWK